MTGDEVKIKNLIEKEKFLANYEGEDKIISFEEMEKVAQELKDKYKGLKSQIPTLDRLVDGFVPGELIILSGWTGHGKSTFAQALTYNFSKQDIKCLWLSFEISAYWLLKRFPEIPKAFIPMSMKRNTIQWIEDRIWEAKLKYETSIVFIDNLEDIAKISREGTTSLQIGEIIHALKNIAIRHNVVIFLSVHTHKTEQGKELGQGSVRDSGIIEDTADIVLYIWRLGEDENNQSIIKITKARRAGIRNKKIKLQFSDGLLKELDKRSIESLQSLYKENESRNTNNLGGFEEDSMVF